jgi:O-antigen/teichoic acid export membrane protein
MVFVFIGLGNLVNIASGVNCTIIILSKYYKFDLFFQFFMIIAIISTNIILIPLYGVNGAAIATMISIVLINVLRLAFIYRKFKIHPFEVKTLYLIFIAIISYLPLYYFQIGNSLLIHALSTIIFGFVYTLAIFKLKISEEINTVIRKYFKIVGIRI